MIYVMSDIHGRIDLFNEMLDKINLQEGDKLYILGDSIDRGGGLQVLFKIMELHEKGLCELIWGNHEYIFSENHINHLDNSVIADYQKEVLKRTIHNKNNSYYRMNNKKKSDTLLGSVAELIISLKKLSETLDNNSVIQSYQEKIDKSLASTEICHNADEWETFKDLNNIPIEKRRDLFLFFAGHVIPEKYVEIEDKSYLLLHGGLYKNTENGQPSLYQLFIRDGFYMNPVDKSILKSRGYKEDTVVVFGHTTTRDINIFKNGTYIAPNKIWYDTDNNDKIGIDCGASFPNGQLACLRLDDMKEFYVRNEQNIITPMEKISQIFSEVNKKEVPVNE